MQPSSLCINTGNPEIKYKDTDQTRNDMGSCRNNITEYIVGDTTMCQSSQNTFTIDASPNHQYAWNIPPTWEIANGEGTNTIEVVAGGVPGDVFVTITGNNQVVESLHIPAEVDLLPSRISKIKGETKPCINSKVKYSVSPIQNANEYIWDYPNSWNNVKIDENSLTVYLTKFSGGGKVSVAGMNECGEGQSSSINVYPGYPIEGPPIVPIGVKSVQYSVNPKTSTDVYYIWRFPKGWRILYGQGTNKISVCPNKNSGFVEVAIVGVFTSRINYCPLWVEMVKSKENLSLIEDKNNIADIQVFPNPTNGKFTINSGEIVIKKIIISDVTGKQVIETTDIEQNETIDLSDFESGIYIIKFQTDRDVFTTKVIKK